VVIANFNVSPGTGWLYKTTHKTEESEPLENNVNAISYVFLDLTKLNLSINELKTPKQRWCYFFQQDIPLHLTDLKKATGNNHKILCAYDELNSFNLSNDEWHNYEQWLEKQRDTVAIRKYYEEIEAKGEAIGEAKGEAKGEAIGEAKVIEKIAINMIDESVPDDTIAKFTGLSVDSILQLKRLVNQETSPKIQKTPPKTPPKIPSKIKKTPPKTPPKIQETLPVNTKRWSPNNPETSPENTKGWPPKRQKGSSSDNQELCLLNNDGWSSESQECSSENQKGSSDSQEGSPESVAGFIHTRSRKGR